MNNTKWLLNVIIIFSMSVIALATSLFLYIYWYIKASTGLYALIKKFNLDENKILAAQTWVVILVLSILVGIILLGIFLIFLYNQKVFRLYKLQNNFINNFTHELKTPVTSLKLYLETFLKYDLPRCDQIKYINFMLNDTQRLSETINQILNLAKIESKSYKKGNTEILDIISIVKDFYIKNESVFQKNIINIYNPSNQPFFYQINKFLFEMLLMNISVNAIKYNESETPQIDITFYPKKYKLYVYFKDNGIGFEKSETKKIFNKFYQIRKLDNIYLKGSGLGLYLVQHIARLHKFKIMAESKGLGNGAVFILILPLKK